MKTSKNGKKTAFYTPLLYAFMIIFGVLSGMSHHEWVIQPGLFIADVFIRIFKCLSLPIIGLSIIVTISRYKADGLMRGLWQRTMTYTLATTFVAALVSCGLYLLIHPSMVGIVHATTNTAIIETSYWKYIAGIIPDNFFAPFLEHQVMSVLMLGILIGTAIRFIPDEQSRQAITLVFRGAHSLLMVMTNWVIMIIPLGVYGFITATVVQLRHGADIKGIGQYLLVIVLANLVQGFILLPLWLKAKKIAPMDAMRKMMPALTLAFFSKSSVGTLPVTMDTAENRLGVRPEIARFVLPLCTSLNMNGCAAFIFATVIYLMQNHGIPVTLWTMFMWVIIATVAAIGNAGVPMGCFFLSASLLASMNVPITLMGIILPFYTLIDMLETALNVWSDSCVAKVVDEDIRRHPQFNELLTQYLQLHPEVE